MNSEMEKKRFWLEKPEENTRDHCEDQGIAEKKISDWILGK
jgi:hypothetical protein